MLVDWGARHAPLWTDQIAAEQKPRLNLVLIEILYDLTAVEGSGFSHRDRKAEPGWLHAAGGLGQDKEFLKFT
jgi:hypothetical protein